MSELVSAYVYVVHPSRLNFSHSVFDVVYWGLTTDFYCMLVYKKYKEYFIFIYNISTTQVCALFCF